MWSMHSEILEGPDQDFSQVSDRVMYVFDAMNSIVKRQSSGHFCFFAFRPWACMEMEGFAWGWVRGWLLNRGFGFGWTAMWNSGSDAGRTKDNWLELSGWFGFEVRDFGLGFSVDLFDNWLILAIETTCAFRIDFSLHAVKRGSSLLWVAGTSTRWFLKVSVNILYLMRETIEATYSLIPSLGFHPILLVQHI